MTSDVWGVPNNLQWNTVRSGQKRPTKGNKMRNGSLQKRAEMIRHPCILGDTPRQAQGAKSEVLPNKGEKSRKRLPHPCLLGGPRCSAPGSNLKCPTSGQSGHITPAFFRFPNALHGGQISNGPQVGKAATSPLRLRRSQMLCTGKNCNMAHKWA